MEPDIDSIFNLFHLLLPDLSELVSHLPILLNEALDLVHLLV